MDKYGQQLSTLYPKIMSVTGNGFKNIAVECIKAGVIVLDSVR